MSGLGAAAFGIKDEEDKLPTLGRKRTGRLRISTSQNSRLRMLVAFAPQSPIKIISEPAKMRPHSGDCVYDLAPFTGTIPNLRWLQLLAAQAISEMARSSAKPSRMVQFLLDEPETFETRSGPYRIAFGSEMNEEGYSLASDRRWRR